METVSGIFHSSESVRVCDPKERKDGETHTVAAIGAIQHAAPDTLSTWVYAFQDFQDWICRAREDGPGDGESFARQPRGYGLQPDS